MRIRLQTVRIKGFRGFRNIEVDFENTTVLVGTNNAGKEILKHLGDLKPITDDMSKEKKLAIIQSEFERLYDPNHPVRFAIETLDSVEEVRIIKEALK
jgi:predicted ATP-binding protein involved in virulence